MILEVEAITAQIPYVLAYVKSELKRESHALNIPICFDRETYSMTAIKDRVCLWTFFDNEDDALRFKLSFSIDDMAKALLGLGNKLSNDVTWKARPVIKPHRDYQ
jgi:hypothetical protein